MNRIVKKYSANHIPNLSDGGIEDFLSYQPKSDYRTPIKIEKPADEYSVIVTLEED
jgi:hypothetical protein